MTSHADKNEDQLKQEALRYHDLSAKELRGTPLTIKEAAFVNSFISRQKVSYRNELLREVPKTIYCDLAGRRNKSIDEFGIKYSIPINGPVINLFAAINALHSKVIELAATATELDDVDEIELEREKLKQEIVKLKRQSEILDIDIKTRMKELVSREDVADRLSWLSGQLQALGSRLHRVGGSESQLALNEFLENMAVELDGGSLSL